MNSAHKSSWEIAEVVFGIPFLLGIALHFLAPLPLASGIIRQIFLVLGILLILISLRMIGMARRELAHYHQPTDPGQPTSKLVTTGIFSVSRNPLYLAAVILFLGMSLAINMPWTLAALLTSIILCHVILIVPEESYLKDKFGDEYLNYTSNVHRWLGRG